MLPRFRLVLKAVVEDLELVGKATDGTSKKVFDFPLQNGIGLEANGIMITFFLQYIGTALDWRRPHRRERAWDAQVAISLDHGQQHSPSELGTGVIAGKNEGF